MVINHYDMDQQKEINKLLSIIKTRTLDNSSQEDIESIIKYSYLKNIPIYASFVLIRAHQKDEKNKGPVTKDGWINISYENKIKSLQENILRIKKSKIVTFPVFDKKWKKAFLYSFVGLFVLVVFLVVNIVLYNQRTKELAVERQSSSQKTQIIDTQKNEFQNTTEKFSTKVLTLSDSLKLFKEQKKKLILSYTEKILELNQANTELIRLKSELARATAIAKENSATKIKSLEKANEELKKMIDIYELQINRFKEIGFNVGEDIEKVNNCKDLTYSESSKMIFEVLSPVNIRSIKIKAKKEGPATFYLLNSSNNIIQKRELVLSKGIQIVNLGFYIRIEGAYTIEYNGIKIQSLESCQSFPYTVKNLIRLKQCYNNQYSFFNWRVAINI